MQRAETRGNEAAKKRKSGGSLTGLNTLKVTKREGDVAEHEATIAAMVEKEKKGLRFANELR